MEGGGVELTLDLTATSLRAVGLGDLTTERGPVFVPLVCLMLNPILLSVTFVQKRESYRGKIHSSQSIPAYIAFHCRLGDELGGDWYQLEYQLSYRWSITL